MGILTGGAFLVAFAVKLGASNLVIGLLAAIGPLSQLLQLPGRGCYRSFVVITDNSICLWSGIWLQLELVDARFDTGKNIRFIFL